MPRPVRCPTSAFAVEPTQTPPTALETPIWKTITIGGSKGVNAIRLAMETAPCLILVGDDADEILGRPGSETKRVDDFAAMSDEELRAYVYGKDKE